MFSSDWSLVLFTILVQSAVGIVVITEGARLFSSTNGATLRRQTTAACVLTAMGLVLSLTHLGTPTHSVFTIMNLGNSWLSREILSVSSFFGVILVLSVLRWRNPEARTTFLSMLAIALGLIAVYVMSRVYLLETVPVWDNVSTVFNFFGTMLLAGAVTSGVIGSIGNSGRECDATCPNVTGSLCIIAQAGLTLEFIAIVLHMIALSGVDANGISGLDLVTREGLGALVVRIAMICAGVGIFSWFGIKAIGAKRFRISVNPALSALALVLGGEIIGRLMFYGTYMRIGI